MLADMEVLLLASKLTLLTANTANTANTINTANAPPTSPRGLGGLESQGVWEQGRGHRSHHKDMESSRDNARGDRLSPGEIWTILADPSQTKTCQWAPPILASEAALAAADARLGAADVLEGESGFDGLEAHLESVQEEQAEQEHDQPPGASETGQGGDGKHGAHVADAAESMRQVVQSAHAHGTYTYTYGDVPSLPPAGSHRGYREPAGAESSERGTGTRSNGHAVSHALSQTLSTRVQNRLEAETTIVGNCFGCADEASDGEDARLASGDASAASHAATHFADSCGRGASVTPHAAEADALVTSQVDACVTCSLAGRCCVIGSLGRCMCHRF